MSHVTLQGLVEDRSAEGDNLAVTWLFVALFSPQLVIGPFAGVLADRVDRKRVVVACYLGSALTAAGLATLTIVSDAPPLGAVYLLAFTLGATFSFIGPSAGALTVNAVTPEDVPSAISTQAAVQNVTRVAGPILAAAIIASGSFEVGFVGFTAATLIAAMLMRRVDVPAHDIVADDLGVFARMGVGFNHARERRPAVLGISTVGIASMFGVAHTALIPSFTSEVLGEPEGRFGLIVASTGVGAIVGALSVGYSKREASLSRGAAALGAYGVCLTGFALSNTLGLAIAFQVVLGFCYFMTMTTIQTLVQQVVADDMRGRVMSLFGIAWGGLVWVGTIILGLMADARGLDLGERTTLLLTAGLLMVYGTVVALVGRGMPTGQDYAD
ncbi:MAG: MFS transporter [Acidimicrobiales bacterium]|nr:MAG: MFS transporter [Acidimicrobiales bacterium]